jgi:DNA-binding transcriptional MerR regulator
MQQVTDRPRLFSIGAVARALGLSESVLRKWEKQGLIDGPARIGGDDRRAYREDELEALRLFASARRRQQQQQPAQHS